MGIVGRLDRKESLLGNATIDVGLAHGEGYRLGVGGKLPSDPHPVPRRPSGAAQPQIAFWQACVWVRPASLPGLLLVALFLAGQ